MKRVLVVYYSQTGQLRDIVRSTVSPLVADPQVEVTTLELKPATPYPFPWPVGVFFNTFPETVYEEVDPLQPIDMPANTDFDLVILGYSVWFLSPSKPITAFLQSPEAKILLAGKPVITLIGCRNMWLSAQERMKQQLSDLGARLIDNIVLTDSAHSAFTFISTPAWMLTGKKGPFLGGTVPEAGVSQEDIAGCARFGRAIAAKLPTRAADDTAPMLGGLGAVSIFEGLMDSEKVARKSFLIWGRLLRACGKPGAPLRGVVLGVYVLFLFTLICTVVPLLAVIKSLIKPLARARIANQRAYYAQPSGEDRSLISGAAA
jgi:hypothetical protein